VREDRASSDTGKNQQAVDHASEEGESAGKFMFDKVALQKDIEAQAGSLEGLRHPLQALLEAQTALAYGKAGAEERYKRAQGAISGKIKTFGRRALSSQEVELLAVYLFSGGEPSLVENILHSLEKDPPNKTLLEGAIAYVSRDLKLAGSKLQSLDLAHLQPPVLSRVLLVQSQTISLAPVEKARLLEQAAGLSPGTLVEEASIRRLVQLWADVANARELMRWSRQYLRRFPKSYYMDDFIKSVSVGILKAARRGDAPRKNDIDFILRSLALPDASRMALVITKSSLDAGLKELCITFAESAAQVLPGSFVEKNTIIIHGLACKAAETPAFVLKELANPGIAGADATSRQVLTDAQLLASNILQEKVAKVPRTPGETQEVDRQLDTFAASVAQQLKSSFRLLQESKK
jgi:chemotaxis protein MotC